MAYHRKKEHQRVLFLLCRFLIRRKRSQRTLEKELIERLTLSPIQLREDSQIQKRGGKKDDSRKVGRLTPRGSYSKLLIVTLNYGCKTWERFFGTKQTICVFTLYTLTMVRLRFSTCIRWLTMGSLRICNTV